MMLATVSVEDWRVLAGIIGGLVLLVSGQVFKFWIEFLRDRRDRESNASIISSLKSIADSNTQIREGQIVQNGKLSEAVSVNHVYHTELIRAIDSSCKFSKKKNKTNKP